MELIKLGKSYAKKALLIEALEVAQNSLEYDGEQHKADAIALLIFDIKEGN